MNYRSSRIGRSVKLLREERGMMSKDLAAASGLQPSHVSEIENGRRKLSPPVLEKLAKGFGISTEELGRILRELTGGPDESPAIASDESMQLREDGAVYRASLPMISNMPDTAGLARDLVSLLPREEVFRLLHEFTAAGEAGDIHALRKARALLEIIPTTHPTTAVAGG